MTIPALDFTSASVWLDTISDDSLSYLKPCHYINLPLSSSDMNDFAKVYKLNYNSRQPNVVNCLRWATHKIKDTVTPPKLSPQEKWDQALALRLILHLVGDIHQPLHCAGKTLPHGSSDHGGNRTKLSPSYPIPSIQAKDHSSAVNLHQLFDAAFGIWPQDTISTQLDISPARQRLLEEARAELMQQHPLFFKRHQSSTVESWVEDGYYLAFEVYQRLRYLPSSAQDEYLAELPSDFIPYFQAKLKKRLWLAGERLAWLLQGLYEARQGKPFPLIPTEFVLNTK